MQIEIYVDVLDHKEKADLFFMSFCPCRYVIMSPVCTRLKQLQ